MSTALRIASVTHVLKDLLNNGLIDHNVSGALNGNVSVTALAPDKIETATDKETTQLNLFMYYASYNQGWRNVSLPAFDSGGGRVNYPPLAIDLHYLLTAYGSGELHTDILLGYGMQLFHETAVLDRNAIRQSIAAPSSLVPGTLPLSLQSLSTSDLADQVELIKISPEFLSIEDISKLWPAFGAKYRPTAAYKATVVLIESRKPAKSSLPVRSRNIYVKPFRQPVIESIMSQSTTGAPIVENQRILSNYRLYLTGKQFQNDVVQVNIDGNEVDIVASNMTITDSSIAFDLPPGLSAGLHEIEIVHPLLMGSPPVLHNGVTSKAATFVLSPDIIGSPVVENLAGAGSLRSATIRLKVDPVVQPDQKVILLLNEITGSGSPRSYSFEMPAPSSPPLPTDNIAIPVKDVKKADYMVRIKVNGAASPLKPDTGPYNSPAISLP